MSSFPFKARFDDENWNFFFFLKEKKCDKKTSSRYPLYLLRIYFFTPAASKPWNIFIHIYRISLQTSQDDFVHCVIDEWDSQGKSKFLTFTIKLYQFLTYTSIFLVFNHPFNKLTVYFSFNELIYFLTKYRWFFLLAMKQFSTASARST